jgi:hypothetical protein
VTLSNLPAAVTSLYSFARNVPKITGSLTITNTYLTSITGFNSLAGPIGGLDIESNPYVRSLPFLSGVTSVTNSFLMYHMTLSNWTGINGITAVGGNIVWEYIYGVTSITPNDFSIQTVSQGMQIAYCDNITSINITSLTYVYNQLYM